MAVVLYTMLKSLTSIFDATYNKEQLIENIIYITHPLCSVCRSIMRKLTPITTT